MRSLLVLGSLIVLVALAGCGAATPTPAAPSAQAGPPRTEGLGGAAPADAAATTAPPRLPLTLSYSALVASQSPSWIAQDAGLYDRYGLDVNLVYISSAQQNVAALMAGEVDVALNGGTGVVEPTLNGADIAIFAGTKNQLAGRIMARPEIASIADLRGKRVGMTRRGGNSHYMGIVALARFGLEPERDVFFVGAGGSPETVAALSAGAIDAAAIVSPGDYEAERRGFKPLLDVTPLAIPYPATQATARRPILAAKEEALWRYTQALADAVHLYKSDRERALRVIGAYTQVEDRAALEAAYEIERTIMASDLRPDLAAVRAVMEEVAGHESRVLETRPEDYVDFRFVERLAAARP
jgi:NitT/TauT family transport system substrate-binding protein